jgi:hypothetical protein
MTPISEMVHAIADFRMNKHRKKKVRRGIAFSDWVDFEIVSHESQEG